VAADDRRVGRAAAGCVEPGHQFRRGIVEFTLELQIDVAVARHQPHARHGVDDQPQPVFAVQRFIPALRLVAIHMREKITVIVSL